MATLLNRTVDEKRPLRRLKELYSSTSKGRHVEAMAGCSKEVLSRAEVDLAIVKANLAATRVNLALEK